MTRIAEPRRPLVVFATAVFIADVIAGAVLFLLQVSALTLRDGLVSLALIAALAILQLWIARGLLRGDRRAWAIGLAFAVWMVLPVSAGIGLPLLNAIYAVVSTVAFGLVLVALVLERRSFSDHHLPPARV